MKHWKILALHVCAWWCSSLQNFAEGPCRPGRTCVVRVLQVEQRRSLLLPHLLVFLQLLPVLPEMLEGRAEGKETFLEPNLPQEDVQHDGSHHEADEKGESGSQDLHAGPGVSLSISWTGADAEDGDHGGLFLQRPRRQAPKSQCSWRVGECASSKVWFPHRQPGSHRGVITAAWPGRGMTSWSRGVTTQRSPASSTARPAEAAKCYSGKRGLIVVERRHGWSRLEQDVFRPSLRGNEC